MDRSPLRRRLAVTAALIVGLLMAALAPGTAQASPGGPVVLMGIDAEDAFGTPGGHGPAATYTNIVNNIQAQVTKVAPNPLLVIGCGKSATDDVTTFWNAVAPIHTCVNGAAAISAVDFTLYKMIAVASDANNTPSGGLTCSAGGEDAALDARAADIAAHVNGGGGLLGFTSDCPVPFGYVSGLGTFSISFPPQYDNITPTAEGLVLGVNDTLDVCCWHDIFDTFPAFLEILAFKAGTDDVAAIGGSEVILGIPTTLTLEPPTDVNPVGTQHCVTATVRDQFGELMEGITVNFTVTGSVTTSGSATTNADGEAEFCYTGPALAGSDVITAYADTNNNNVEDVGEPDDIAAKTWVIPVSTPGCKVTYGGRITAANGDKATFGGNAKVPDSGPQGQEEYQDHGPAVDMNVHSIDVDTVTCSGTSASIFGTATIDGSGMFDYRIDVTDNGEPGTADTYRIRLSNGYDSGVQTLVGGNVQVH
jgi:hypothetical protein